MKRYFLIVSKYSLLNNAKKFTKVNNNQLEKTILPEIFIWFFITSNPTQILTLKLTPNLTLTQTLILTLKKANKKSADKHFSFSFYSLQLENFR